MRYKDVLSKPIRAENLNLFFQNHGALRGVRFDLDWGECLTIMGPNGSGKTTLMRIVATLLTPTDGTVWINGKPTNKFRSLDRRIFGTMLHHTLLYPDLTIFENLNFYGLLYGIRNPSERVFEVANDLYLTELLDTKVRSLSRGTQTRVALARALIHEPPLLLLDEPDTGLDHSARDVLIRVLNRHQRQGGSTLLITHDIRVARAVGDRVLILSNGQVATIGTWDNLNPDAFQGMGFHPEDKHA
jgi:heme exporter protein A